MATLADLDRAYIAARQRTDGAVLREERKYHGRARRDYTLRDRVRADIVAERDATDGRNR
jgi:hypothetical protein